MASGLESIALAVAHLERMKAGEVVDPYDRFADQDTKINGSDSGTTVATTSDLQSTEGHNATDTNSFFVENVDRRRSNSNSSNTPSLTVYHNQFPQPRFTATGFPPVLALGQNQAPARIVSDDSLHQSSVEVAVGCPSKDDSYAEATPRMHGLPIQRVGAGPHHNHDILIGSSPTHPYPSGFHQHQQPSSFHHSQQQAVANQSSSNHHRFRQDVMYRLPLMQSQHQQHLLSAPSFAPLVQHPPLTNLHHNGGQSTGAGSGSGFHRNATNLSDPQQLQYPHPSMTVTTTTNSTADDNRRSDGQLESAKDEVIGNKQQIHNQRTLSSPSPPSPLPSAVRAFTDSLEDFLSMELDHSAYAPIPKPTDVIVQFQRNDVLLGRGGETNHHTGNIQYRQLVKICQPAYLLAKRRDKPKIAERIVHAVRCLSGRFLKRDPESNTWRDVGNTRAREKTSQALREGAPELRGGIPCGDDACSLPGNVDPNASVLFDSSLPPTSNCHGVDMRMMVDHRGSMLYESAYTTHNTSSVYPRLQINATSRTVTDTTMIIPKSSLVATVDASPESSPRKKARSIQNLPSAQDANNSWKMNTLSATGPLEQKNVSPAPPVRLSRSDGVTATISGDDEENVVLSATSSFSTLPQARRLSTFDDDAVTFIPTSADEGKETKRALPRLKLLKKRFEQHGQSSLQTFNS